MENKFKKTRFQYQNSRHNNIKKVGFDYRNGKLMRRVVSTFIYSEVKREAILDMFSDMFAFLVDSVKNIQKQYKITVDKNYTDFN